MCLSVYMQSGRSADRTPATLQGDYVRTALRGAQMRRGSPQQVLRQEPARVPVPVQEQRREPEPEPVPEPEQLQLQEQQEQRSWPPSSTT